MGRNWDIFLHEEYASNIGCVFVKREGCCLK